MKKIALFCVICLLLTAIPLAVSAGEITVAVTDVANDVITISGAAPVDTIVTVLILNPDKQIGNITGVGSVQYMGTVYSEKGQFSCPIKINTAGGTEGEFEIIVNIDGKLAYHDENFIFYSNSTKLGYVTALKENSAEQLLEKEDNNLLKLENVFTTYSLSGHELYKEAKLSDLAAVICAQKSVRDKIESPADVSSFLTKVLVLNAFAQKSSKVYTAKELKYTEVWACDESGIISPLYSEAFTNQLSDNGKKTVISHVTGKNYKKAEFNALFDEFEGGMLYALIMENAAMGTGHIEPLILDDYNKLYECAGFDCELLSGITNAAEKNYKLNKLLGCTASSLEELAEQFNTIMGAIYPESTDNGTVSRPSAATGGGISTSTKVDTEKESGFVDSSADVQKPNAEQQTHPFSDMAGSQWADEAVSYLYKNGIVSGREEGKFEPVAPVKRAELIKMLVEAFALSEISEEAAFSDVTDQWFAPYVKRAMAAKIILGDGDMFYPENNIKREDAALILYRILLPEKNSDLSGFSDAEGISAYAKEAVASMAAGGFISGMGNGTFSPGEVLTRAQAAQLIFSAIQKGGTEK